MNAGLCAVDWVSVFQVLQSVSLIGVGVAGAVIASLQVSNQKKRLKMDLFDRRSKVYETARSAIESALVKGKVFSEDEFNYLVGTSAAKWLFDETVRDYLEEDLWGLLLELTEDGRSNAEKAAEQRNTKSELQSALRDLDAKVEKFMKLEH